jgi:hypothetical protein
MVEKKFRLEPKEMPVNHKGMYIEALDAFISSNEKCVEVFLDDYAIRQDAAYASFNYNIKAHYRDKVRVARTNGSLFLCRI